MKNLHIEESGIFQKEQLHPLISEKEAFTLLPVANRRRLYKRINKHMNPTKSNKSLYLYFTRFSIPKRQFNYIHAVMYKELRDEAAQYLNILEVGRKDSLEAIAEFDKVIPKYKQIFQQDEESRERKDPGTNQEEIQN